MLIKGSGPDSSTSRASGQLFAAQCRGSVPARPSFSNNSSRLRRGMADAAESAKPSGTLILARHTDSHAALTGRCSKSCEKQRSDASKSKSRAKWRNASSVQRPRCNAAGSSSCACGGVATDRAGVCEGTVGRKRDEVGGAGTGFMTGTVLKGAFVALLAGKFRQSRFPWATAQRHDSAITTAWRFPASRQSCVRGCHPARPRRHTPSPRVCLRCRHRDWRCW